MRGEGKSWEDDKPSEERSLSNTARSGAAMHLQGLKVGDPRHCGMVGGD